MPGSSSDKSGCLYIYRQSDNKMLFREEVPMIQVVGDIRFHQDEQGNTEAISSPTWLWFDVVKKWLPGISFTFFIFCAILQCCSLIFRETLFRRSFFCRYCWFYGWWGQLGRLFRTTASKTGIDGYGVPVRNDIFVNAMISRKRHCLHDESSSCGTSSTRRLS